MLELYGNQIKIQLCHTTKIHNRILLGGMHREPRLSHWGLCENDDLYTHTHTHTKCYNMGDARLSGWPVVQKLTLSQWSRFGLGMLNATFAFTYVIHIYIIWNRRKYGKQTQMDMGMRCTRFVGIMCSANVKCNITCTLNDEFKMICSMCRTTPNKVWFSHTSQFVRLAADGGVY